MDEKGDTLPRMPLSWARIIVVQYHLVPVTQPYEVPLAASGPFHTWEIAAKNCLSVAATN